VTVLEGAGGLKDPSGRKMKNAEIAAGSKPELNILYGMNA